MNRVAPSRRPKLLERHGQLAPAASTMRCAPRWRRLAGAAGRWAAPAGESAELALPVGELRCEHRALQPRALPDRVVRVLDGQRRQRRLAPLDERIVGRRELAIEARPSTSRPRRCDARSASSTCSSAARRSSSARSSGPAARSKGCRACASMSACAPRLARRRRQRAEIGQRSAPRLAPGRSPAPARLRSARSACAAPRAARLAPPGCAAAPPPRAGPAAARPPACCTCSPRQQPVEKPQPLLRERQRQIRPRAPPAPTPTASAARDSAPSCSPAPRPPVPSTVGRLEEAAQRQLDGSSRARRATTWVASSECPPSSKKLSCTPTCSTRSTSRQTSATSLFERVARRHERSAVRVAAVLRCRQGAAVELAVGGERQLRRARRTPPARM